MFGWRLGFPVPAPAVFFFPYFAAPLLLPLCGLGLLWANLGPLPWAPGVGPCAQCPVRARTWAAIRS